MELIEFLIQAGREGYASAGVGGEAVNPDQGRQFTCSQGGLGYRDCC